MQSPRLNPAYHQELFKVTDQLRTLSSDPTRLTVDNYRAVLSNLCASLKESLENGLNEAIRYASDLTGDPGMRAEARAIVNNLDSFARFVRFEHDVLIECGASRETAVAIAHETEHLREQLADLPYDADAIQDVVTKGRDAACAAANEVRSRLERQIEDRQEVKRTTFAYGIGLTIANASATAITMGAAAPVAGLSLAAGGLLIGGPRMMQEPGMRRPHKH